MMKTEEYKKWLDGLNIGDKVCVDSSRFGLRSYSILKIERLTPTQFIMKNSKYRRADGYIVGDGYSRIEPITNDVLAVRERTDLNQWFSSLAHAGVQKISTETLRAMKDAYVKAIEG